MTGALQRVVGRPPRQTTEAVERCDLCGLGIPERHRHVLDREQADLLCTCQACTLLFTREAAGRGHYRLVPDTRVRLADVPSDLGVPVGLAFVVPHEDGQVVAHYPSPMGTTQHTVEPATWAAVVARCPELAGMAPEVQALLVNTARGAREHWLVPIDDCYRLVAVVRREWRGLSGGSRVWPEIAQFFDRLATTSRGPRHREER
jgi:hypothetical protein